MADDGMGPLFLIVGVGALAVGGWEIYRLVQANAAAAGGADAGAGSDPAMTAPQAPAQPLPAPAQPYAYYPAPYPVTPYPVYPPAGAGVRSVSAQGRQMIMAEEGLQLTRYRDGKGYSIGYGHQIQPGENYTTITSAKALQLFNADIARVQQIINSHVRVALTQDEYDALADLVYNVGHVPTTVLSRLNAGDYAGAGAAFAQVIYAQGVQNPGLVNRRQADINLWNEGVA